MDAFWSHDGHPDQAKPPSMGPSSQNREANHTTPVSEHEPTGALGLASCAKRMGIRILDHVWATCTFWGPIGRKAGNTHHLPDTEKMAFVVPGSFVARAKGRDGVR